MGNIVDEFSFLEVAEQSKEEISKELIGKANRFINKANNKPDSTHQGIPMKNMAKLISIKESDKLNWKHVVMELNIGKLRDINGERISSLSIPKFIEEVAPLKSKEDEDTIANTMSIDAIKHIKLSSNLINIDDYSFMGYTNLDTIEIPEEIKLERIGKCAFAHCYKITDLDLRCCSKLKYIEKDAFFKCDNLKTLKIPGTLKELCDLSNTNIKKIYIDRAAYTISDFIEAIDRLGNNFWYLQ